MNHPSVARAYVLCLVSVGLLLTFALAASTPIVNAWSVAAPSSVTIAGDLQSELGCPGDWQPDCAATHLAYDASDDVWQGTFAVPAGNWQYKAALNDSWTVNYGLNATPNGPNIPLSLDASTSVKFYYDDKTHWVTDNHNAIIATVPGSFQSELGCPGDWQPDCLRSWLEDPSGSGTYAFVTTALPAGSYEAKVAINESWAENYGQGGVPNGPNIPFTVTTDHQPVKFVYDPSSHILTIVAGHAHDNHVEWIGLGHNSRDTLYRTPGGAVPAGTPVKIRFRTFHNDVTSLTMRVWDVNANAQQLIPMSIAASDVSCYDAALANDSCDFWQATLSPTQPNDYWYRFIVRDGTSTAYYADDTPALDGGWGAPSADIKDNSWALMAYSPNFSAPTWMRSAVIYQIFPDRFRNGVKGNDPKTGDPRYDDPVIALQWSDLPEGYCRNYAGATAQTCPWRFDPTQSGIEQPRGRDYYGGDLKGVTQQLDYLQSVGINALYFNPIFYAKSNHRYDTADYKQIDPYLGTLQDFNNLVKAAKQRGIHIILDGVFNHMSSDSPNFDRYHHYATTGACESASSSYRAWFTFIAPTGNQPHPCVPTTPNGTDTYYVGWFGFDSIPVLTKSLPAVQQYFLTDPSSVSRYWLQQGSDGWRLDVMGDPSFPNGYWEQFRQIVKQQDPGAVIIGELWQKDSTLLRFLRGDRADSTMDYRLRDALLAWLAPQAFDSKGFADGGHYPGMNAVAARLQSIREDYPDAAYFSLMNLLDSHDTERALWTLTPGQANRTDREFNAQNLAQGKLNLRIASLAQFSLGGAPTIYYGDEVGLTGDADPDDRRTYPWADLGGQPDNTLLGHYQALARLHTDSPALTSGDFRVLLTDETSHSLAFGRKTGRQAAIFVGGNGGTFDIPVAGYIPNGVTFHLADGVNNTGDKVTVANGMFHVALANKGALLFITPASVDLTPPASPTGLTVTNEGNGQVSLSWNAVADAAGYNLYISPVSGGGSIKVNNVPLQSTRTKMTLPSAAASTNSTVNGLRNAQTFYFVVTALDAPGNESQVSNEVSALPHLTIGWANTQWPPTINQIISAVNPTPYVYGQVWIDGVTNQPGATPSLMAQLGFGPHGTNPASSAGWRWIDAAFNTDVGNNDEYKAQLLPDATGDYDYLYRYSTTNGRDWLYADLSGPVAAGQLPPNPGRMTVSPSADATPPATPANLLVAGAAPTAINLTWDALTGDATLYGYEVLRSSIAGGPYTTLALVTANGYADNSVLQGSTYFYVVRAVDTSFNRSANSNEVQATANLRTVTLTFNVTVPSYTDASGKAVHIAGTLSLLSGGLPDWDPGAVQLTKVDSTHWTITLSGNESVQLQYKYTLGSWDYVEKDASCGEINNRSLTLLYGTNGQQIVNDTVLNWRNSNQFGGPCGN